MKLSINNTNNTESKNTVANQTITESKPKVTIKRKKSDKPALTAEPIRDAEAEEIPADANHEPSTRQLVNSSALSYSTYEKAKENKKTGKTYKVTHAKIMGFKETDEVYQHGTEIHGSASYETVNGQRVYGLYFSHRYAAAAKDVCEALNAGKTLADCKAIIDAATETNAKKREEWKAKTAKWAAERKERKEAKAKAKETKATEPKTYSAEEVIAMMKAVIAGGEIPENIDAALKTAAA